MIELSHSKKNRLPDAPNGRKRWAINTSINVLQMKEDGGEWEDIDATLDKKGLPKKAPYELTPYLTGLPGFHYKSKQSGEFDVRLKEARQDSLSISDIKPKPNCKPVIKDRTITWPDLYPDVDVVLTASNTGVSLNRIIKSASAPLEYDVTVTEVKKGIAKLIPLKPAIDAEGQLIKMEEKPCSNGRTETLKLEVVEDEDSNAKPIKYPIFDSTVIDEQIGTDVNDGHVRSNGTAYTDKAYVGIVSSRIAHIWLLFNLGTAIGGVTIDTAYISTYEDYDGGGSTFTTQIFLNDVESPAVPTGYADYNGKALTTEYIDRNTLPGAGWVNSASLVDMFQELVDTYDPSNVMVMWRDNGSDAYERIEDYNASDSLCAKLYLEYTEGGGLTEQGAGGGTITPAATLNRKIFLGIGIGDGVITPSGALGTILKLMKGTGDGVIAPVGILGRKIARGVGMGIITPAATLGLMILRAVGLGTITPIGTLSRNIFRLVGEGTITPVGILSAIRKIFQDTGSGAITPVGTLARKISRAVGNGVITPAGILSRKIILAMGEGIVTPSATLGRNIARVVGSGIITPIGDLATNLIALINQVVGSGAVTPIGILGRNMARRVGSGIITPAGALGRKILLTIGSGAITPTGALSRKISRAVGEGVITPIGVLSRNIFIAIGSGVITPVGILGRKISKAVGEGAITPIGDLATNLIAAFTQIVGSGVITPVGELGRKIFKVVGEGAVTPIGDLATILTGIITQIVGSGIIKPIGTLTILVESCVRKAVGVARLAISKLPIAHLDAVRLKISRLPLCKKIWRSP